ncbi:hypothetical protein B0H16DRAFT_1463012 [Mycena metata]|uniref:Uncharacterized protein n=1 Tax=Mycena metata TaxID=1033252 RepID=A0AAD7IJW3_9AGAR|nr:hypothetical protein B0H16DRAFT_1463012 [Mycena metata]
MGTYRDRGGTEGDGHSKGGGRIERRCRDRETVGTGARYRRGGGTGGQIGLVAPRTHTHGVGTRGTQLRWGDRGTCYGTSTVGGTLRGTSRAWYIHGGGTRGTNWTCSTSGAHTRCGDKGDTAAVGGQGDMLRSIDGGRDIKRDITCWYIRGGGTRGTNWTCSTSGAHTRCGDKGDTAAVGGQGDILRNIDGGRDIKRDITCQYIRGGGTRGTNWTCSTSGAHTRCGDKGDTAAVGGQGDMLWNIDSGRDVKRDITCLVLHGGGTRGTFLYSCWRASG